MRTVVLMILVLIVFAVFVMLIGQWGHGSQDLLSGVFNLFGTLTKSAGTSAPSAAPGSLPGIGGLPAPR